MTPELEVELNKIGWKWASRNPWHKVWYELVLRKDGGLVASDPQEARAALARHRALCASVINVVEGLRALSDDAATSINLDCIPVDERDKPWPDHITRAASALEFLAPGLIGWADLLAHEAQKARRGGQVNEPAYRIAETIAEIYVVGLGEKPTIGRLEDGSGPSGLYGRVTAAIFSILEVRASDVFRPCRTAIDRLTEARMRQLLDLHHPLGPGFRPRMARNPQDT